jgi:hypothetical protein
VVAPARRKPRRRPVWETWPDERLLDVRLCDLGISGVEGTWVERPLARVRRDLEVRGLRLRPHAWFGEEWFSPGGVPGIAVPFYLAHPRLARLERAQMLEVEGGTFRSAMKILRHETGHALQHGYRLHRRARWRETFGPSSRRYPSSYRPSPGSKRYVLHLDRWYAQAHPDEDFAETFAVWFSPRSDWRRRYAGWPALGKLEYVDALMRELRGREPPVADRTRVEPLSELRHTLREHYARKRAHYVVRGPRTYDDDLRSLFCARKGEGEPAARFVRRHRAEVRELVARFSGDHDFAADQVCKDMEARCRELGLRAKGPARDLLRDFAILLSVQTLHCLYSRGEHPL